MGRALSLLFGLVLVLAAPAAFGQVETMVKTPPLQDSDTFSPFISIHNTAPGGPGTPANPPWAGWAGAIMSIHLIDNTELDVDAFHAALPGRTTGPAGPIFFGPSAVFTNPLGPRSQNAASSPRTLTLWHPSAPDSGITILGSQNLRLGTAQFHVKGSDPAGNSDVDLTAMFWNIWHIRQVPVPGSTFIRLDPSDLVWVSSPFQTQMQLHTLDSRFRFPPNHPTPFDPNAHWLHISQPITFHLTGGDTSAFYATFLNTATLGIEHVPEPASAALIGLGLTALAASRTIRRRRLAAAI